MEFIEKLGQYQIVIALVLAVVVLAVILAIRSGKRRQLKNEFERLEIKYNEIMSVPILFKMNKVNALLKVNQNLCDDVEHCQELFESVRNHQEKLIEDMGLLDDAIAFGKIKQGKEIAFDLNILADEALELTETLNNHLDRLLEEENQQRMRINQQKEFFRALKGKKKALEAQLSDSNESIDLQIKEIEQLFSIFEEWMYASDFQKATDTSEDIELELKLLDERLDRIPRLYERARGIIPELLDELSRLYQGVRQEGVFLEHLEVAKNIGLLTEVLKEDLIRLSNVEMDETEESLDESEKRLQQLVLQIQKESSAHTELKKVYEANVVSINTLKEDSHFLEKNAERIEVRFQFNGFKETLRELSEEFKLLLEKHEQIDRMIHEESIPASSIFISSQELNQDLRIITERFKEIKNEVEQANADEIRAEQQLLKLHLIINDVQVRIKKRSLPIISEKYDEDLKHAFAYTNQIKAMLAEESLDVDILNATVNEAIDYIYKLHNNVNNLVGAVDMCEHAIVYANRFRAYVPEIDAQLTRAELAFNTGEYTQSLKTIIDTIDRYKPNTQYEEMIRENAKSAQ